MLTKKQAHRLIEERANGRTLTANESDLLAQFLQNDPAGHAIATEIDNLDLQITTSLHSRWPKQTGHDVTPVLNAIAKSRRKETMMTRMSQFGQMAALLAVFALGAIFFVNWPLGQANVEPAVVESPMGIEPGAAALPQEVDGREQVEQLPTAPPPDDGLQTGPNPLLGQGEPPALTLSGTVVEETILLTDAFEQVEITGFGEVEIRQGDQFALSVITDDAYVERLRADIVDGVLVLGNIYAEDGLRPELSYQLTVPNLTAMRASGGAMIQTGELTFDQLELEVSGSGMIMFKALDVNRLSIDGSGGGQVRVVDKCRIGSRSVTLSGGAEANLANCEG